MENNCKYSIYKDFEEFSEAKAEGETLAYIQDTNMFMYFVENQGWVEVKDEEVQKKLLTPKGNLNISLYDLNKSIIKQIGKLDIEDEDIRKDKINLLSNYVNNTRNTFYMLYGKEISYFTVFVKTTSSDQQLLDLALKLSSDIGSTVLSCLHSIGEVYSIEYTMERDAIEIWIEPYTTDEVTCLYLFPYDNGLVPFVEE